MATRHCRGARASPALLVGLVVWTFAVAPFAAAAEMPSAGMPTVTTVAADPNPVREGLVVTLTARIDPNPGGGTVTWVDEYQYEPDVLGESDVDPAVGVATLTVTLEPGFYGVRADFRGSDGFAPSSAKPLLVTVLLDGKPTTTTLEAAAATTELGEEVALTAIVNPPSLGVVFFMDGITEFRVEIPDADSGVATLLTSRLRVGDHRFVAAFVPQSRDQGYGMSQSAPVVVSVVPPTQIRASGFGVSDQIFYPVRDGYRDALEIRGRVAQPARLTVDVVSRDTGKTVRTIAYGEKVGTYKVLWDGRDAAGKLLPAGRYRVVQRLRDAWGNSLAKASETEISPKRLHWVTESTTRAAVSADERFTYASAMALVSRFPGGVQLDAGSGAYPLDPSAAWLEFRFRLPEAAVYRKVSCAVLGATDPGRGAASLWLRDWTVTGPSDDEWDLVAEPAAALGWTTGKGDPSRHISAKGDVLCSVDVYPESNGQIDVAKVRLTFTYGVLR